MKRMTGGLCAVLLLVVTAVAQAEIYKYYDASGNLVLSDKLPKDSAAAAKAERIEAKSVMTVPALAPSSAAPVGKEDAKAELKKSAVANYVVVIQSPQAEETYQRNADAIAVAYSVTPSLQKGDRLEVLFDGSPAQDLSTLPAELERGSHSLVVRVINAEGRELASASSVFYIQQHSQFSPTAPKPKPPKPQPK